MYIQLYIYTCIYIYTECTQLSCLHLCIYIYMFMYMYLHAYIYRYIHIHT